MDLERLNPPELARPSGFSHAVVAHGGGTPVFLAGQIGEGPDLVAQFERALVNLLTALGAAGGVGEHLAKMTVYCTDVAAYEARLRDLGEVWRRRVGSEYPAMTLVGVTRLLDPAALVELDAIAIVPQ